jgi:WD40 repeat protein
MCWSADGRWLVADSGGKLVIWDREKKERRAVVDAGLSTSVYTYVSPNKKFIVAACRELKLIDIEAQKVIKTFPQQTVRAVFTPDSRRVFTAGPTGEVMVWSTADGAQLRRIDISDRPINWVAVSPSGRLIAAAGSDAKLYLLDAQNYRTLRTLDLENDPAHHVAFTRDRKHLVAVGESGVVRVYGTR